MADGAKRGFGVRLDPAVDGRAIEAFVELFCTGNVAPHELTRILSGIPHVVEALTVTGHADAMVRLRAETMADLETALERVRLAPQVDKTRSALVLSHLVDAGGWGARAGRKARASLSHYWLDATGIASACDSRLTATW